MIWDHQIWSLDLWGILKRTENLETAKELIRFATSTESLARQAGYIPCGPVRRSSQSLVPDSTRPYLPIREEHMEGALRMNTEWWAQHLEDIGARFERWLERPVRVPRYLPH